MALSDWQINKATGTATWQGYTIKRMRKEHGAHYWAYCPGGGLICSGWGEDANAFVALCEKHYAEKQQPA